MPPRRLPGRRNHSDDHDHDYDHDDYDDYHEEAPQLKAIDINLPEIVAHNFQQWNERFDKLQDEAGDGTRKADIFAITGTYTERGRRYRAGIDFERHKLNREIHLTTSCDIDSVLGVIMGDLPISPRANFYYLMLADPSRTLTTNLHLPEIEILRDAPRPGFNPVSHHVPIHYIPNARFGRMGHFLIRVCFPALFDPEYRKTSESPNVMNDEYMEVFYNDAVRPATSTIIHEDQRRQWPPEYGDELYRTRPGNPPERRQRLARLVRLHTERVVSGDIFGAWFEEIKRLCDTTDKLAFARGLFLLVEGKGLKDNNLSKHHPPVDALVDDDGNLIDPENPRTTAIEAVLSDYFVIAEFAPDEWYLDIATNVSGSMGDENGPPVSLFINSDLHPEIINHYSEEPLDVCTDWVRKKTGGYARDEVAHLQKFVGLRKTFGTPGAHGIVHFQGYTSEKSVTYRPDLKDKAIRTSPVLCMRNWTQEAEQHFRPLADVYWRAPNTHPVAVRFESRVPFESYPYVHLAVSWQTLEPWLFCARNTAFWGFKWRRLNAIWNVLEQICAANNARSKFSLHQLPEVGSLVILLVYMANALVNRPDDGKHFDEVHDSGCIHKIDDYRLVPLVELGYYIIHTLRFPQPREIDYKLPRISSQRTQSMQTIIYLFATEPNERTELHVLRLFRNDSKRPANDTNDGDAWGIVPQKQRIIYPHTSNKQRVTLSLPGPVPNVFADRLPDEEVHQVYSSEEEDDEVRERATSVSAEVARIVHTYPVQIIAKVPNRRNGLGSWCRLDIDERSRASSDLFCDASAPARIFVSWNNFGRDGSRWDATLAGLFPTLEQHDAMGRIQNLSQMSVWLDWRTVLMRLSPNAANKTVTETRKYVSENWRWLPYYTKKKLWVTGESPAVRISRHVGPEKGGPWIIFNPRFIN